MIRSLVLLFATVVYAAAPAFSQGQEFTTPATMDPQLKAPFQSVQALYASLDAGDTDTAIRMFDTLFSQDALTLPESTRASIQRNIQFVFWKRSMRGKLSGHRVVRFDASAPVARGRNEGSQQFYFYIESSAEKQRTVTGELSPISKSNIIVQKDANGKYWIRQLEVTQ